MSPRRTSQQRHQQIFQILGKRWSALIIRDLLNRPRRFREMLASMGEINDKVLSQRLKELEALELVERRVYPEVPVRVEYTLTEKGRDLQRIIEEMELWNERWMTLSLEGGQRSPKGDNAPYGARRSTQGADHQPLGNGGS